MNRVDYALALELNPEPVGSRTGEDQAELHLRTAIGDERVGVDVKVFLLACHWRQTVQTNGEQTD